MSDWTAMGKPALVAECARLARWLERARRDVAAARRPYELAVAEFARVDDAATLTGAQIRAVLLRAELDARLAQSRVVR